MKIFRTIIKYTLGFPFLFITSIFYIIGYLIIKPIDYILGDEDSSLSPTFKETIKDIKDLWRPIYRKDKKWKLNI